MASGWWKSTHANLALGSPVDFAVTTAPQAPRGFPKLASIATGAGHFLGGTPAIVVDDVIYYAGDNYTQDTEKPVLCRYDGRVTTEILELPYITGTTPSKAILSICADDDGRLFISTWDSGTTSSNFAGRVYVYDGTLTRIDGGLFTAGKLPYALAWFNSALYIGVNQQDPDLPSPGEIVKLPANGLPGGPTPTCTLTGTTHTYRVGAYGTAFPAVSSPIGKSASVSVLNRATLDSGVYNSLSWDDPGGTVWNSIGRTVSSLATGEIQSTVPPTTTLNDTGLGLQGSDRSNVGSENITLTVTPTPAQATTSTYKVGAVVGDFEFLSSAVNVTTPATLYSDLYVALSWTAHSGATAYNIYRTAGHSSQGLIGTTASTSFNDTGIAATTATPTTYSTSLAAGGVSCMVVYNSNLYIGTYQASGSFGKVWKIDTSDTLTLSTTAAPGGTARAYNGYTAGIVFNSNLYMGYWNDDTTDICLIDKFDGASWSTVKTISGAGARPWMCFAEADSTCYAYGGGDGKTGILYDTTDGTTWTDQSALLPSSLEAVPFIGSVNVLGGF